MTWQSIFRTAELRAGAIALLLTSTACLPNNWNPVAQSEQYYKDLPYPVVIEVSSPQKGQTLTEGDELLVDVRFSRPVSAPEGTTLKLQIGKPTDGADHRAKLVSGSDTDTLRYRYTVQEGDDSEQQFIQTAALLPPSGKLITAAAQATGKAPEIARTEMPGNQSPVSLASRKIRIDTKAPTIENVKIPSGKFGVGRTLDLQVTFNEPVRVEGAPTLSLALGTDNNSPTRQATYLRAADTSGRVHLFRYAVTKDDPDDATVSVQGFASSDLIVNDAPAIQDLVGHLLSETEINESQSVSGSATLDTTPPRIASITVSKPDGSPIIEEISRWYANEGDTLTLKLGFSEGIVKTGSALPTLEFEHGGTAAPTSFTTDGLLSYSYQVKTGENADPLKVATLTGPSITDGAGNPLDLTVLPAITTTNGDDGFKVVVDTTPPKILSWKVEGCPVADDVTLCGIGSTLTLTPQIGEGETWKIQSGDTPPDLQISIGLSQRALSGKLLQTGSLQYTYTVQRGDASGNLFIDTVSTKLEGLQITDRAGNVSVDPALPRLADAKVKIDTKIPLISEVRVTGTTLALGADPTLGILKAGDQITLQVYFDRTIEVTGSPVPVLKLKTAETVTRDATYASDKSGAQSLAFSYTVEQGDNISALELAGEDALVCGSDCSIRDRATKNSANLNLPVTSDGKAPIQGDVPALDTVGPRCERLVSDGKSYNSSGETVPITLIFNEPIAVQESLSGMTLPIQIGAIQKTASFSTLPSENPLQSLIFNYPIQDGDEGKLTLRSGTVSNPSRIKDRVGNAYNGSLCANLDEPATVDRRGPQMESLTVVDPVPTPTPTAGAGDLVRLELKFNEEVVVSGSDIKLLLNSRDGGAPATLKSAKEGDSSVLLFEYEVEDGDTVTEGGLAPLNGNALTIGNGASIRDQAGNDAEISGSVPTGELGVTVDTSDVRLLSVTSSWDSATIAKKSSTVPIQLNFSKAINAGSLKLTLQLDNSTQVGPLSCSGSNTKTLTCDYTVSGGDFADALEAIQLLGNPTLNGADVENLTLPTRPEKKLSAQKIRVDGKAPTITEIRLADTDERKSGQRPYRQGDKIPVELVFDEAIYVTAETPTLTLNTSPPKTATLVNPPADPATASKVLRFEYTVAQGDSASDLNVTSTTLGSTVKIKDLAGNEVTNPALPAKNLATSNSIKIDTTAPTITSVTKECPDGCSDGVALGIGKELNLVLTFSEPVEVVLGQGPAGWPTLTEWNVTDASGTVVPLTFFEWRQNDEGKTTSMVFQYVVAAGHTTNDEDITVPSQLPLNGTTIKDFAGNPLAFSAISSSSYQNENPTRIDSSAPAIASITLIPNTDLLSEGAAQGPIHYFANLGDTLTFQLKFSEKVVVSPEVRLRLRDESNAQFQIEATPESDSAAKEAWTFSYTVANGINADTLRVDSLHGGTILSPAGNPAVRTLTSTASLTGQTLTIDTTAPTVTQVTSSTADASYTNPVVIPITVEFSEPLRSPTATPSLTLNLDSGSPSLEGANRPACTQAVASGDDAKKLSCPYTVQDGDNAAKLSVQAISTSSDLTDRAGNEATLAIPTDKSLAGKTLKIDTKEPTIASVTSSAINGKRYGVGSQIHYTVSFSEPVSPSATQDDVIATLPLTLKNSDGEIISAPIDCKRPDDNPTGTVSTLTCAYTVEGGHQSDDLRYSDGASLTLASGVTLKDAAQNSAVLALPDSGSVGSDQKTIIIDTTQPQIASVHALFATQPAAAKIQKKGTKLQLRVNFTEKVKIAEYLDLRLKLAFANLEDPDGTPRTAEAKPIEDRSIGSDTELTHLDFKYVVTNQDETEALKVATLDYESSLSWVQDLAGNDLSTALASHPSGNETDPTIISAWVPKSAGSSDYEKIDDSIRVDGVPPKIEYLAARGVVNADTKQYFKAGQNIDLEVHFNERVSLKNSPDPANHPKLTLALNKGETAEAIDQSFDSDRILTLRYTVTAGQNSDHLEAAGTDLSVGPGTTIEDEAGNVAETLALPLAEGKRLQDRAHLVVDTTAPRIASIVAVGGNPNETDRRIFSTGDTLYVILRLSETPVALKGSGNVNLTLNVLSAGHQVSWNPAAIQEDADGATLVFPYTVDASHTAAPLDLLKQAGASSPLSFTGTLQIQDPAGNALALDLPMGASPGSLASQNVCINSTASGCAQPTSDDSGDSSLTAKTAGDRTLAGAGSVSGPSSGSSSATSTATSTGPSGAGSVNDNPYSWQTVPHSVYLRARWPELVVGGTSRSILLFEDDHCERPFELSVDKTNRVLLESSATTYGFEGRPGATYTYQLATLGSDGVESRSVCSVPAKVDPYLVSSSPLFPRELEASEGSTGKEAVIDAVASPNRLRWNAVLSSPEETAWIEFRFSEEKIVRGYEITPGEIISGQYDGLDAPLSWRVLATSDSVDTPNPYWTEIDRRGDETSWSSLATRRFEIANEQGFTRYRIVVTGSQEGTASVSLHELNLFETLPPAPAVPGP